MSPLYNISFVALIVGLSLSGFKLQAQTNSVGIGTPFRTQSPNAKAVLHLETEAANPQGFLLPRLDRTKFVGLTSSENGLIVYDQTDNLFYYWVNDKWVSLAGGSTSANTWRAGAGTPGNSIGQSGDYYYDSTTKDLYQKNTSGTYDKLFSLDADRFWQSITTPTTYTTRNVGIGITNPTQALEVDGSILSTALKSTGNQVVIGDSSGKMLILDNEKGMLTNDGNGILTWEPLTISAYLAGDGISIVSNTIENTGDTNALDDITDVSIANGEVTGTYSNLTLKSGSVTEDKIANGSVTEQKILDGSITTSKIADESLTVNKIVPAPIGNMQLVTDPSGVVTWAPTTNAALGAGEIAIGNSTGGINSVPLAKDVSLDVNGDITVERLLGRPMDQSNTPYINQVLQWDGSQWTYTSVEATTYASGDVTGLLSSTQVTALQGRPVKDETPAGQDVLQWDGSQWIPAALSLGGDVTGTLSSVAVERLQNTPIDGSITALSGGDASKVLTWDGTQWTAQSVPTFTLPNTSTGAILVGDGSTVNTVAVSGDLSLDNTGSTQITHLQGTPLTASSPLANQVLLYNGSSWIPSDILPGGDLDASLNIIQKLQGQALSATTPTLNDVLTWTGAAWQPQSIPSFTLPNTGNGQVLIGDGSAVNTVTITQDISITSTGQATVTGLQSVPVNVTMPATNQVLAYDGTQWTPTSLPTTLAGDVTGTFSTATVEKLQGTALDPALSTIITDNRVLTWDGISGHWTAKDLPAPAVVNTGTGEFAIGQGSTTAARTISGDLSIDANGQATVLGLQGKPIDNTAALLTALDNDKILAWDGIASTWTPKTLTSIVIPALESQTYSAAQTRYYSVDPNDFSPYNNDGDRIHYNSNSVTGKSGNEDIAASLHLPNGAIITKVQSNVYDNLGNNMTVLFVKTSNTGTITTLGSTTTATVAGNGTVDIDLTLTPEIIDNQNYSYKVVFQIPNTNHLVYGARIIYTITKPD